MDDTPHIRQHLEDARRALAPVAALLQWLDVDATHAAEDPTPEMRAALAAHVHQALAALAAGADALLAIRDRLGLPAPEYGADAGRERDTEGG
jgi:hypothetical protein